MCWTTSRSVQVQICQTELDNFLEVAQKLKIEGLLSTEEPETKHDTHIEDPMIESFPAGSDYTETKVVKANKVRSNPGEKVVSLTDMTEVDEKIEQLMEESARGAQVIVILSSQNYI